MCTFTLRASSTVTATSHSPECAVRIGENTIVGVGVRLLGVTHPIDWRKRNGRSGMTLAADMKIGKECFVGAGVTLLHVQPYPLIFWCLMLILLRRAGVTIGDGCVIGAGSVVTKSMPAYHVVVGNPARPCRKVASDVPDAPGLVYEVKGDRVVVVGNRSSEDRPLEDGPKAPG